MPILVDHIFKLGVQILRKTKKQLQCKAKLLHHKHVRMLDSFLTVPVQY